MHGRALFLDIDGCLNWDRSKSYCVSNNIYYLGIDNIRVKRLAQIVNATDAKIVLTSDWGIRFEIGAYKQTDKHAKYLSNKLRKQGLKVYDKIDWYDFRRPDRGFAILDWLDKHPEIIEYVVIDDEYFWGYNEIPLKDHMIHCFSDNGEEYSGLTDNLVTHAIDILNNGARGFFVDEDGLAKIKSIWGTR